MGNGDSADMMQSKPKQWAKGVITRVPLDLSIDDIKMETEAI